MKNPIGPTAWISLVALAGLACASPIELRSVAPEPAIEIDGAYEDWKGRFTRIEAGRSVAVSVANDREQLYLCLVTRDLALGGLLQSAGFTLWLDPAAGRRRALGLRVAPVELEQGQAATPALEVVFDGAEFGFQLASLRPDGPLDVRAAVHADVVVYEIRLALARPLAPGAGKPESSVLSPGPVLGIGIEAAPTGPPPGRGPGQEREQRPAEPLRVWLEARLAPLR